MNVLITSPDFSTPGGVANYFAVLREHFSTRIDFFSLETPEEKRSFFGRFSTFKKNQTRFRKHLFYSSQKVDLVHINPSFRYAALIRDGMILRNAKSQGTKALIFFHGWSHNTAKLVDKFFFGLFFRTYNLADAFIVLASEFKNQLISWGFKQPVYLETAPVDDSLLQGVSSLDKAINGRTKANLTLLFLSRIEKEKGIRETLEAFRILVRTHSCLRLIVAGNGSFLPQAKKIAAKKKIDNNVIFLGHVQGEQKRKVFLESDIYIFPTYAEGMPTTVLESMAFGIPVVTRPVGGLKDFFINGEFGFLSESKDPSVLASLIEKLILDRDLSLEMGQHCYEYARKRFMASIVSKRLEKIYYEIVFGVHGQDLSS